MTALVQASMLPIDRWRRTVADGNDALARLATHIERLEPEIQALVPEDGRFDRLQRDLESSAPGPLATVPIGIKDIFHVSGLETRAGSKLPPDELIGPEATCVTALRRAGAIILGKTVSTEFAYYAPGATRNPHDPGHTPGGSSSGSAAAVAAGYCPVALGTQTIGSICRPASFCGVVGYKPSAGRISTEGVIPLAPSLDHVGVFTTCIGDLALVAETLAVPWNPRALDAQPVLGIPQGPYLERASALGSNHFRAVCNHLQGAGWTIKPVRIFDDFDQIEARHHLIVAGEAARVHRQWYEEFGALYHPRTLELIERGLTVSDQTLAASLPELGRLRTRIENQMQREAIDFWISPAATGPAPAGIEATGDPVMNLPWTQAGLPALSLPTVVVKGELPMGLQIVGRFLGDEALLSVGASLEKSLEHQQ